MVVHSGLFSQFLYATHKTKSCRVYTIVCLAMVIMTVLGTVAACFDGPDLCLECHPEYPCECSRLSEDCIFGIALSPVWLIVFILEATGLGMMFCSQEPIAPTQTMQLEYVPVQLPQAQVQPLQQATPVQATNAVADPNENNPYKIA